MQSFYYDEIFTSNTIQRREIYALLSGNSSINIYFPGSLSLLIKLCCLHSKADLAFLVEFATGLNSRSDLIKFECLQDMTPTDQNTFP